MAEGQLRTTREDVAEFFWASAAARVIFEVGTHSAWVRPEAVPEGSGTVPNNDKNNDSSGQIRPNQEAKVN